MFFFFTLLLLFIFLPSLVHLVVIPLVVSARHVVHPCLIVQIPADGLLYAFFELEAWFPAKLSLKFARVDGVTHVVALAVGHVSDEVHVLALLATKQAVNGLDDNLYYVDVLPFVEAADVVGVSRLSFVEDEVDGAGVVFNIEPVPHVLALSVYGQRLLVADVVYK